MICTSIQHKNLEQILTILDDPFVEMAEIRLDLCELDVPQIKELFESCEKPLIATCRSGKDASARMEAAVEAGARYLDLDISAPVGVSQHFQKLCRKCGTELIRSFHDFDGTPSLDYLQQIEARCRRYGADVAKIVVTARSEQDCETVLSLYDGTRTSLVAFAMGEQGRSSRLECLRRGAPFSYASFDEATAPGQIPYEQMHKEVYGEFRGLYRNDFTTPASKSFAQRAIIAAALAQGTSHLRGYTPCDDSESAISVAKQIGAKVTRRGTTLTISGIGPLEEGQLSLQSLNVGESGLLTRLSIPLLAALNSGSTRVEGKGTLSGRPLGSASDIMAAFGVILRSEGEHHDREVYVPLTISGKLIPGTADVPGKGGSQLISGLLMALPLCAKSSKLYVSEPKSIPYMFITLDVLRKFGVQVGNELEGPIEMLEQQDWSYCSGIRFSVRGGQHYTAADMELEGDWSAAANFLVAGAIYGSAEVSGLDQKSLQADISILDVLVAAGACVAGDEDVISVRKAPLECFDFDLSHCPDIFPITAVLAAFCDGTTTLAGVGRLRSKESDRAEAIVSMLTGFGVRASIDGDVMSIEGETLVSRLMNGRLLHGGQFTSRHDHRMAMALSVAALGADAPVVIDDTACVAKSFPDFFEQF